MIELKSITKNYVAGETTVRALKGVSLTFRKNEFVSILGPSGCGKTTLLNIIGGLDRYTSGDVLVDGKSTKNFKDADWDAYRNNSIGFVFQSYNLISHQSVLENVELSLTLSGVSPFERKKRAAEVLGRMGLSEQLHKKPNQLSGGQMQRVAIARALINDPDIILADEPTGALDTETSRQIMEILKEISKERLIIMVTHNTEIAETYSTRLIRLLDGEIISDSDSVQSDYKGEAHPAQRKRTSMSFMTAFNLSLKNLFTKKGRTIVTSIAGSIGIIGIALILAISAGMSGYMNSLMSDVVLANSISVSGIYFDIAGMRSPSQNTVTEQPEYPEENILIPYNPTSRMPIHYNILTSEYVNYLKAMDTSLYTEIQYTRGLQINMLYKNANDSIISVDTAKTGWQELISNPNFLSTQYDVIAGTLPNPSDITQIFLVVDKYNRINTSVLNALGMNTEEGATLSFEDLMLKEFKYIENDDFYVAEGNIFNRNSDTQNLYDNATVTLKISGILREKKGISNGILGSGLACNKSFMEYAMGLAEDSVISHAQSASPTVNVRTGSPVSASALLTLLREVGANTTPTQIDIFAADVDSKKTIQTYLDAYNTDKSETESILYMDMSEMITDSMKSMLDTVTIILIAFTAISLVVSSIMIGIITYVSVIERTKEIGVLRSLGARKKDVSRVFNAETLLIGFSAGFLGVLIAFLLTFPINALIATLDTGLPFTATLAPVPALVLVAISMTLTLISGLIPARIAAKKDPVVALRTES